MRMMRIAAAATLMLATPAWGQDTGTIDPPVYPAPAPAAPPPPPAAPPPPPPPPPMQDPDAVPVIGFPEGTQFFSTEPNSWTIGSTRHAIVVPAGFVTDFASIPRAFQGMFATHGRYSRAAMIHDYLYWTQSCSRTQADNLFLIAMIESGVDRFQRVAIHRAVRLGGGAAWRTNAAERRAGLGRVVPPDTHRWLARRHSWPEARAALRREGVRDPAMPVSPAACGLGNGTAVP